MTFIKDTKENRLINLDRINNIVCDPTDCTIRLYGKAGFILNFNCSNETMNAYTDICEGISNGSHIIYV